MTRKDLKNSHSILFKKGGLIYFFKLAKMRFSCVKRHVNISYNVRINQKLLSDVIFTFHESRISLIYYRATVNQFSLKDWLCCRIKSKSGCNRRMRFHADSFFILIHYWLSWPLFRLLKIVKKFYRFGFMMTSHSSTKAV